MLPAHGIWRKTVSEKLAGETAAQIEFLTMTEMTLRSGKVASMSELQYAFQSILKLKSEALKQLLLRVNES